MNRTLTELWIVCGIGLLMTGCSKAEPPNQAQDYSVSGLANVDASTRVWLDSVLAPMAEDSRRRDRLLNGDLHQFGQSGDSPRFLLDVQGTPFGAEKEVFLFVLDRSLPNGHSAPFSTGVVYNEFNYEPLSVADFNEDGVLDFAYCTWAETSAEGSATVVSYTDSWNRISAEPEKDCGSQAAP